MSRIVLVLFVWILSSACSSPEADLKEADRLIESGRYDEAMLQLQRELTRDFSDTTQYDRIHHRIFLVRKGRFFGDLRRYTRQKQWAGAGTELTRLDSILNSLPQDSARLYRFDYYVYRAEVDSMLGDREAWAEALETATRYPYGDEETLREIFGTLAFYHAEEENFRKALDMMDSMLRSIQVRSLEPSLRSALYLYMEGRFDEAFKRLKEISSPEKKDHWIRLERFLKEYGKQLKQENRFKLW